MTFEEKIGSEIADAERRMDDDPASFEGRDWWQLSAAEEEVFAIDRTRFARMMVAWYVYEAFMDLVAPAEFGFDEAVVAAEREKRADIVGRGVCEAGFQEFAREYPGLTLRESAAMYAKQKFWNVRQGLVRYGDEQE